jgi:peptide/nickel transport system permease protein
MESWALVISFVLRRLAATLGVLFGISLVAFTLTTLSPGDPATILLEMQSGGVTPSQEAVDTFREQLGLNQPAPVRYVRWLYAAVQGDLGFSYRTGQPVAAEIAARLPATMMLAGASLAVAVLLGVPLGVVAAVRRDSALDVLSRMLAILGATIPNYVLSLLLVLLFAVVLGWLPAFGSGSWQHFVLPIIALSGAITTQMMRLTRASLLETLQQDHIRTARSKGLAERQVISRHGLRNALLPVVTTLGVSAGNLLSGTVIVERIFSWPGIGKYAVDAIFLRDYPVIQGVVLYMAIAFVLVNLIVDISYSVLDPRVSFSSQERML